MPVEPKATLEQLLHHLGFPATVEEHMLEAEALKARREDAADNLYINEVLQSDSPITEV